VTPDQLSAIRARLDAVPRVLRSSVFVDIEVNDLRALLDEVERLRGVLGPIADGTVWNAKETAEFALRRKP